MDFNLWPLDVLPSPSSPRSGMIICILFIFFASSHHFMILSSLYTDIGFEVPDKFLVGYALDYNEYFRDLNVSILY